VTAPPRGRRDSTSFRTDGGEVSQSPRSRCSPRPASLAGQTVRRSQRRSGVPFSSQRPVHRAVMVTCSTASPQRPRGGRVVLRSRVGNVMVPSVFGGSVARSSDVKLLSGSRHTRVGGAARRPSADYSRRAVCRVVQGPEGQRPADGVGDQVPCCSDTRSSRSAASTCDRPCENPGVDGLWMARSTASTVLVASGGVSGCPAPPAGVAAFTVARLESDCRSRLRAVVVSSSTPAPRSLAVRSTGQVGFSSRHRGE